MDMANQMKRNCNMSATVALHVAISHYLVCHVYTDVSVEAIYTDSLILSLTTGMTLDIWFGSDSQ